MVASPEGRSVAYGKGIPWVETPFARCMRCEGSGGTRSLVVTLVSLVRRYGDGKARNTV